MESHYSSDSKEFTQLPEPGAHTGDTNDKDDEAGIVGSATGKMKDTEICKDIPCSFDSKDHGPTTQTKDKHVTDTENGIHYGATGGKDITHETKDTVCLEYSFIDTEETLEECIGKLRDALKDDPIMAVDCEGDSLSRDGKLQIISVATKTEAFLVDVATLKSAPFDKGLRAILEDKNILKLMFDCREDADALLHQYNVKLDGVLDIQLLEIIKRAPTEQTNTSGRRSARMYEVVKLKRLTDCIAMHIENKEVQGIKRLGTELNNKWGIRPLTKEALQYATADVLTLFKLFEKMWPNEEEMERLKIASRIYVDLKRSKSVRTNDEYERNCYLPIDVIPDKGQTSFACGFIACVTCRRRFPGEEFSKNQLSQGIQKCRTCKRVKEDADVQKNREDNWARDAERESQYCYYTDSDEDLFGYSGLYYDSDDCL